jgi:N-acyl-D-amino-acid deacylase
MYYSFVFGVLTLIIACTQPPQQEFDYILRDGTIYDGTGKPSFKGDVAIQGDTIVAIGDLKNAKAKKEINASGLAIAPGFINMLSWADRSLLLDGRSMSDIKQGVTLEVFGEGWSPAPVKRKATAKPVDSPLDNTRWLLRLSREKRNQSECCLVRRRNFCAHP